MQGVNSRKYWDTEKWNLSKYQWAQFEILRISEKMQDKMKSAAYSKDVPRVIDMNWITGG